MAILQKFMTYLGLGPESEYSNEYGNDQSTAAPAQNYGHGSVAPAPTAHEPQPNQSYSGQHQTAPHAGQYYPSDYDTGEHSTEEIISSVRPHIQSQEHLVVVPDSFESSQQIADGFKSQRPIILNLQMVDRDLGRRVIDFASGLCYALDGSMKKVGDMVFLLTPQDVSFTSEQYEGYLASV